MADLKFSCPHCEQHLQCAEQLSGREIQCPSCHHLLRIPSVPGQTAQFTPESGKTWATYVSSGTSSAPFGLRIQKESAPPAKPDDASGKREPGGDKPAA